jgi:hypothetical protein
MVLLIVKIKFQMRKIFYLFIVFYLFNTQLFAQCNGLINYTVSPAPIGGTYYQGTVVTFCFTMTGYSMAGANYLEGFDISAGSGWLIGSVTPVSPPANCNGGGGTWIWVNSFSNNGNFFGPGYFFDLNNDGMSQDDFGDAGNCSWSFCFSLTVGNNTGASLLIEVAPLSDGVAGSWSSSNCGVAYSTILSNSFMVGNACSLSAEVVSQTNLVCANANTGDFQITALGGTPPYQYSIDSLNYQPSGYFSGLDAGIYQTYIVDSTNCSTVVNVLISEPSVPFTANITSNGSSDICEGDVLALSTDSVLGYIYQWLQNGDSISGATSQNYSVSNSGTFSVIVTNSDNCTTVSSTIVVTVYPALVINNSPVDMVVLENDTALFIVSDSGATNYQWQENNGSGFVDLTNLAPYSGVNDDTLYINNASINLDSNQYRCVISNNGCFQNSSAANLYVTLLNDLGNNKKNKTVNIFPNPAQEYIFVNIDDAIFGSMMRLYNVVGRMIIEKKLIDNKTMISTANLTQGFYLIWFDKINMPYKLIIN